MSESDPQVVPLEWVGDNLMMEVWLTGRHELLFRLLVDTGSTHIALPREFIAQLGLGRHGSGELRVPGKRDPVITPLYLLPRVEVEGIVRHNLLVARVSGANLLGAHGLLGMNCPGYELAQDLQPRQLDRARHGYARDGDPFPVVRVGVGCLRIAPGGERIELPGSEFLAELVSARIGLAEVNEGFEAMKRGEVARSVIVFA